MRGSGGLRQDLARTRDNGPKRLDGDHRHRGRAPSTSARAGPKGGKAPKIGVMGGSYGGYSTLMAMTYFAGAYDAGVQERGHLATWSRS